MNYIEAAAIVADHAPDLILDPDAGLPHVCVRKTKKGPPFSIVLPVSTEASPMEPEEQAEQFTASLDAAMAHLG